MHRCTDSLEQGEQDELAGFVLSHEQLSLQISLVELPHQVSHRGVLPQKQHGCAPESRDYAPNVALGPQAGHASLNWRSLFRAPRRGKRMSLSESM